MRRRILRTGMGLLLALAAFFAVLHLPPVQTVVGRYAVRRLERRFNLKIDLLNLRYNLLSLSVSLLGVTIQGRDGEEIPPFFQAESIRVQVPLALLSGGRREIKSAFASKPRLHIHKSVAGLSNVPAFGSGAEEPGPGPPATVPAGIRIRRLELSEASVLYSDEKRGLAVESPALDLELEWDGRTGHVFRVKSRRSGSLAFGGRTGPWTSLGSAGVWVHDAVEIRNLRLELAGQTLDLSGRIAPLSKPELDLKIDADFGLETLSSWSFPGMDLAGRLNAQVRVEGPPSSLRAGIRLRGRALKWGGLSDAGIEAEARWNEGLLSVGSLRIDLAGGVITGRGEVHPLDWSKGNQASLQWDGLDLALLTSLRRGIPSFPGVSSGSLEAAWDGLDPGRISGSADLSVQAPDSWKVGDAVLPPFSGNLHADLKRERLSLSVRYLHAAGASLTGEALLEGRSVSGRYRLEIDDLGAVAAWVLPARITTTLDDLGGKVIASGVIAGSLGAARLSSRWEGNGISLLGLKGGTLTGEAVWESRSLRVKEWRLAWEAAALSLSGVYDFAPGGARTSLDIAVAGFPLAAAGAFFGAAQDLGGSLDFEGKLLGLRPSPLLSVRGGLKGLRFQGWNLDEVEFGLDLAGRELEFDISLPARSISVRGRLELRPPFGFDASLVADASSLSDLRSISEKLTAVETRGTLTARLDIKGEPESWDRTAISGEVEIDAGPWTLNEPGPALEKIKLGLSLDGKTIEIRHGTLALGGASVEVQGRIPLAALFPDRPPVAEDRELPGRIMARFSGLDPFRLAAAWGGNIPARLEGRIEGEIEAAFSSLSLDSWSVEARLGRSDLDLWGTPVRLEKPAALRLQTGKLVFDDWVLAAGEHSIRVGGRLGLGAKAPLAAEIEGELDLAILRPFLGRGDLSGSARLEVRVEGPLSAPFITGSASLSGVQAGLADPDLSLSGLAGEIRFMESRIELSGWEGELNGGKVGLEGALGREDGVWKAADLKLSAEEVYLDYPAGLRSLVGGRLTLKSAGERLELGGEISLLSAEYEEPFRVGSQLFRFLKRRGRRELPAPSPPLLDRLRFDLQVRTENPARVDNNLATALVWADLKLTGSTSSPGLTGRLDCREGGEVRFARNTYQIEQATVVFADPAAIAPDISLRAQTQAGGYRIRLLVSGTPDDLSAELVSEPPLPESDIVSVLLTGRRLEYLSDPLLQVAGLHALGYLEDALLGELGMIAEQAFGLETVRIDTSLVATQENPEARLTLGQHITPELELIFSQGLREADEQTIMLDYRPEKNLNFRATKQDNDAYQFDALQELRFGLKKDEARAATQIEPAGAVIERIEFLGRPVLSAKTIRDAIRLEEGSRFDYFKYQEDLERIRKLYFKNEFLEVAVRRQKKEAAGKVSLSYDIAAGPRVRLRFSGASVPRGTRKEAERLWMEGTFERKRIQDVRRLIRKELFRRGRYQAEIRVEEETVWPQAKTVRVDIAPGPEYVKVIFDFAGRNGLSEETLVSLFKTPESRLALFGDPAAAASEVEAVYRQNGYLDVEVEDPRLDFRAAEGIVLVSIPIKEGPGYRVGRVEFRGRLSRDRQELLEAAGVSADEAYSPGIPDKARERLEDFYSGLGFIEAEVESEVKRGPASGTLDLTFEIRENERAIIEEVAISGHAMTKPEVVRRELKFAEGEPVDPGKFGAAQKRLYSLGIFNSVGIESRPLDGGGTTGEGAASLTPHRVEVRVEEIPPYSLRYGAQYDTETGFGAVAELARINLFGRAMDAGGGVRADQRDRDARAFFRSPYFLGKRIESSLFFFASRKKEPDFVTGRLGATVQQQLFIRKEFVVTYNYTFESLRNPDQALPSPEERYRIGRISLSLSRDKRRNILNSQSGSFISVTGEYADRALASDASYWRLFGQYFAFLPLGRSLTYAAAIRTGWGRGLGGELVPSERFFAGGGSSIRGFDYHEVGPKNPLTGNPAGGDAVFILNQELRFPVYKMLRGAVFLDLGNVYASLSDFNPLRVRKTAGFGLRLNLGFALGRLDIGFKLDRARGESPSRVHFSLGQAF